MRALSALLRSICLLALSEMLMRACSFSYTLHARMSVSLLLRQGSAKHSSMHTDPHHSTLSSKALLSELSHLLFVRMS